VRDPVRGPVLQHEQQPAELPLVPPEHIPEPLHDRDDAVGVAARRQAHGQVRIGLAASPGTAVEPTYSTATASSPSAARSSAGPVWSRVPAPASGPCGSGYDAPV
jgi:hypothetical protein